MGLRHENYRGCSVCYYRTIRYGQHGSLLTLDFGTRKHSRPDLRFVIRKLQFHFEGLHPFIELRRGLEDTSVPHPARAGGQDRLGRETSPDERDVRAPDIYENEHG